MDTGREPLAWAQYQDRLAAGQIEAFRPHP